MSNIILRPYQELAHKQSMDEYEKGIIRQLLVLFTGGGKTKLTISLLDRYKFKRVLWLCWQEELVTQSAMAFIRDKFDDSLADHIEQIGFLNYVSSQTGLFGAGDYKMGCIKADIWEPNGNVVMGSVATMHRRLDRLPEDYFDAVVCDEAHLFGSVSAIKILDYFKPKLLLGLTATPQRETGVMLSDIFQKIVFEYSLDKGIRDGYAAEMDAIRIKTSTSLDNVKTTAGELNLSDLSNEVNNLARNQQIVDSYRKYAEGRQCIAFCVDILHSLDLAETFRNNGYSCYAVSSDEDRTPRRKENVRDYKNGKIQILTNPSLLVTGFDAPDTGCIIMACPTKSLTKYLQAVGRGSRLKSKQYVEKFGQNCIVIDVVDATSRHSLINAWELDRQKPIEERTFVSEEKKKILLEDREAKKRQVNITHKRDQDEKVNLLSLPVIDLNKYGPQKQKEASQKQLDWIAKLGYDVVNESYTMEQVQQILNSQQAAKWQLDFLRKKGYNIEGGCSVAQYSIAKREIEKREQKELVQQYTPNNDGKPFF